MFSTQKLTTLCHFRMVEEFNGIFEFQFFAFFLWGFSNVCAILLLFEIQLSVEYLLQFDSNLKDLFTFLPNYNSEVIRCRPARDVVTNTHSSSSIWFDIYRL